MSGFIIKKIIKIFDKLKKENSAAIDKQSFDLSKCGSIGLSKQKMINGIINLSNKNVREIMIPRVDVSSIDSTISLKDLIKSIYDEGHSRIPVYKDSFDNIIGILHVKDLLKFILEKPKQFKLPKILHKPYFVPWTMPLDDILLEFKKRRLHLAIAVDEYGGFGGIVTLEDVLEEIVGDISDEFDNDKIPPIIRISKNIYDIDSRLTLTEINEELRIKLPSDDFDTIGGYVFDLFGKIPANNEIIRHKNLSFKIKGIEGTRINRIIITILKKIH